MKGETLQQVTILSLQEPAWVDYDRIAGLYVQLGPTRAEELIGRAIEDLAVRLSELRDRFDGCTAPDFRELQRGTKAVTRIADQVGLIGLAMVAAHVCDCLRQQNMVALTACMSRLIRIGEQSLTAVWDVQDLSI